MLRITAGKNLLAHRLRGLCELPVARSRIGRLSLLERHFGGSRSELLLNLLEDEPIDLAELTELEELIRRRQPQRCSRR